MPGIKLGAEAPNNKYDKLLFPHGACSPTVGPQASYLTSLNLV